MVRNGGGRAFDAIRTLSVLQTIGEPSTIVVMHHTGMFLGFPFLSLGSFSIDLCYFGTLLGVRVLMLVYRLWPNSLP